MDRDAGAPSALEEFERPVGYSYSFFHLIFALASMYLAMLMTGWSSSSGECAPLVLLAGERGVRGHPSNTGEDKDLIDVGWASVWVKIGTQWATALLYVWTLVAPLIFPDRFASA